jgi:hypothetical protein
MKVKVVANCLLITTLLLSRAVFAAPHVESHSDAQQEISTSINDAEADAITAHLQAELNSDVHAEVVQRIKADSLQELNRQLQNSELFIHAVPATVNDFEITIRDSDRKIRLTAR